jgi:hypothetical protein
MSKEIASLHATIGADLSPLQRGLANAKQELNGFSSTFKAVGIGLGVGAAAMGAGLAGAAALYAGPIQDASRLSESMNKVNVVFDDSSQAVIDFASNSAQALGQSKQVTLEYAGTFGNLFTSMGLAQGQSATLSTELLTLSSDLASFNNISPEEALEKLRAGLVGESEPLRSLGVNLNEAATAQKAFSMGFGKTAKDLTDAEKVQARYALIMEQSKNATGDFTRTSTGMANSQRIISASFKDASAVLGEEFYPIIAPIVSAFATSLPGAIAQIKPVIHGVRDAFTGLGENMNIILPIFAGISAAILYAIVPAFIAWAINAAIAGAATLIALAPILVPIAAVGAAVALLALAWSTNFLGIQDIVTGVWKEIKPIFDSIGEAMGEMLGLVGTLVSLGFDVLKAVFNEIAKIWNATLGPAFTELWKMIEKDIMPTLRPFGEFLRDNIVKHFQDVAQLVRDAIKALNDFANAVRGTPGVSVQGSTGGQDMTQQPQSIAPYAQGTSYVPRTGLYMLHGGEEVRTKRDTSQGTINITINAPGGDPRQIQRGVMDGLALARARGAA